jgi:hypothetical protein
MLTYNHMLQIDEKIESLSAHKQEWEEVERAELAVDDCRPNQQKPSLMTQIVLGLSSLDDLKSNFRTRKGSSSNSSGQYREFGKQRYLESMSRLNFYRFY